MSTMFTNSYTKANIFEFDMDLKGGDVGGKEGLEPTPHF